VQRTTHPALGATGSLLELRHRPQDLFQAVEKGTLSFDDLGPRVVERKPCGAVYLGHADEPSLFGGPFDFAGYALDTGGIELAGHGKRCNPLAARLNSLADREKGTGGAVSSSNSLTATSSDISAKFALRDGQLLRSLLRQEWPARMDEQNHQLAAGEAKHDDTRAALH
jgi:hypothetical protein